MCKITAILRTYNRPHMLPTMLDCLVNQDYDNFEIIIHNNGSTDNETDKICRSYADKYPNFIYVMTSVNSHAWRGGVRVQGSSLSDYTTYLDDDDRIAPNYLSFLANLASKHDADIAMCGSYSEYEDGTIEPFYVGDEEMVLTKIEALKFFLERKHFNTAPPTKLFKKDIILAGDRGSNIVRTTTKQVPRGVFSTYRQLTLANKIVVHNVPLYYFKKHSGNYSAFHHNPNEWTPERAVGFLHAYNARKYWLLERHPELKDDIENATKNFMVNMLKRIEENNWLGYEKVANYMRAWLELNQCSESEGKI